MTRTNRLIMIAAAVATIGSLATLTSVVAGPDNSAHVEFGRERAGSPFPPASGHDMSGHGRDGITPRTVVIEVGGTVDYTVYPFHQVAIYAPGTTPEDIELSPETLEDVTVECIPVPLEDFRINDPENRVALGPPQSCAEYEWTTPAGTFDTPGRYLVICTTTPHFQVGMYGWVIVR